MHIPPIIQQLAATAGGTPIAWKEYEHHYVIVFEDGRKLTFPNVDLTKSGTSGDETGNNLPRHRLKAKSQELKADR